MFLEVAGVYHFNPQAKLLGRMICHILLNLRTKFCGVMEHTPYPLLTLWKFKELFTLAITKKQSFRPSSFT